MNEMKIIFNNLINKEIYKNIESLICETEDFDEIPIATRLSHIKKSFKDIDSKKISEILIGLAIFLSISARSHAKETEYFNCITFCDWDVYDEFKLLIPCILYSNKKLIKNGIINLSNKNIKSSELSLIKSVINEIGFGESFLIFEEKFSDGLNGEIKRIYVVNKNYL